jgi:hypothetical protein
LSASIIRPAGSDTTIGVGQELSVKGRADDGLDTGYKFAWDWNATGNSQETFDTEFSSSDTATISFTSAGNKTIRLIVRDGNDNASVAPRGGHYAMSSTKTVKVQVGDAEAVSNTIPSTVTTLVFYAVSVSMKNTGVTTWTSSGGYSLGQYQNGTWIPAARGVTGSVAPDATHTFNFNLKHIEPEETGNNQCLWRMQKGGSFFGDQNGKTVWVQGGGFSSLWSPLDDLFAWFIPNNLHAGTMDVVRVQQGEVVQVLRSHDHKINPREVEAAGKYVLRYEASLAEEWDVDYYFHVKFDNKAFSLGEPRRGSRGMNHEVKTQLLGPSDVIIRATRAGKRGLSGTGLILEIPFVLTPGATAPSSLPLVELVATK